MDILKKINQSAQHNRGFSTLEMLIALALVATVVTAVTMVVFGNQSLAVDSQTNTEALQKAQELLESALETSRQNYDSVVATTGIYTNGIGYATQLDIPLASQAKCSKEVIARVSWTGNYNRQEKVELPTALTNIPEMIALGGACDTQPASKIWNPPATWASSNFTPGKATALAALDRVIYMTGDKPPYLFISNTSGSALGQNSGLFTSFANSFDDGAKINDIVVAKAVNGKVYAYVARGTATNQFEVIDVSDLQNPVSVVTRSLAGVVSTGSFPQGFRIFYYDNKVYITVRETTGPELHVFNASTPWIAASVAEIGSGKELNRTVEDLEVIKQTISGATHYIAYMATDKNIGELSIFDVTNPSAISEITAAEPNFSGSQDGSSVFVSNGKVYFGRMSSSGPDIFIFDASNPLSGSALPLLGQKDIGTSALSLTASGMFLFVVTDKTNNELQVFNASPSSLNLISTFNFPSLITNGLSYESGWVYGASTGNDSLRIIYSPH